jgi:hypothetical protein
MKKEKRSIAFSNFKVVTLENSAKFANKLSITVSKPRVRAGVRSVHRPSSGDGNSSVEVYY